MTKKQAIRKSISHWKKMITCAEKFPPKKYPTENIIFLVIKETWSGDHCALCDLYAGDACLRCPLEKAFGQCGYPNKRRKPKNAWRSVTTARTWHEWLYHARRMLRQLESLVVS